MFYLLHVMCCVVHLWQAPEISGGIMEIYRSPSGDIITGGLIHSELDDHGHTCHCVLLYECLLTIPHMKTPIKKHQQFMRNSISSKAHFIHYNSPFLCKMSWGSLIEVWLLATNNILFRLKDLL